MTKLSLDQKLARRRQILNAGWKCFEVNGLHATRMDDIIAAAGLSAGAVYSYFKNKDELVHAAPTTSMTGLAEWLRPILESGTLHLAWRRSLHCAGGSAIGATDAYGQSLGR